MMIPVVELNRGCMWTDEKWHVCARLAYSAVNTRSRPGRFHMRCREHEAKPPFRISFIEEGTQLSLGYKR